MPFKADMHMHSSMSADGEISPETLVAMAANASVKCMAVTDHNRVDGVALAVKAAEGQNNVTVIPGIEIDCDFGDVHLHVLGYGIDHTRPEFAALWQQAKTNECAASEQLLDLVEAIGIAVDRDAIRKMAGDGPVIGEHIAEIALEDQRNADNPKLAPFRPGGNRSDNPFVNFYWDFCGRGKPAHVPVDCITLDECIALIVDTGGIPVLAHPGQSLKERPDCLPDIAAKGVCGVEAFSSYHSPEACVHWKNEAAKNNLFVTCGSDFHGKTKPSIAIGQHGVSDNAEELLAGFFEALGRV